MYDFLEEGIIRYFGTGSPLETSLSLNYQENGDQNFWSSTPEIFMMQITVKRD